MAVSPHLRYSPVNHLIVEWGYGHDTFNDCGLPQPICPPDPDETPAACRPLPIREAIDTFDWERWLPEVIVGVEDPDEEIAANYVRESAIEFAQDARVLQREVVVELQPDEDVYPLFPYEEERICGILRIAREGCECMTGCALVGTVYGLGYELDLARNELHVHGSCRGGERLRLLVWSAPTEDACEHDRFLYDNFRRDITLGARMRYAQAVHFRDNALMRSLPSQAEWERSIIRAKRRATSTPSRQQTRPGSGMWQTGCRSQRRW